LAQALARAGAEAHARAVAAHLPRHAALAPAAAGSPSLRSTSPPRRRTPALATLAPRAPAGARALRRLALRRRLSCAAGGASRAAQALKTRLAAR